MDLMVKPDGPYDFYHHPNVPEARHCQPVLEGFSEAVRQLLQDWPEHPALEQVGQRWGGGLSTVLGAVTCTLDTQTEVYRTAVQCSVIPWKMNIPGCNAVM